MAPTVANVEWYSVEDAAVNDAVSSTVCCVASSRICSKGVSSVLLAVGDGGGETLMPSGAGVAVPSGNGEFTVSTV